MLVDWCIPRSVAHEVMHALGFLHTHQRPDRDEYVDVLFENITPQMVSQYEKITVQEWKDFGVEYSTKSNLHYDGRGYNGKVSEQ